MQVKLHMHFICYLHQLDSGILTESCFLRLGIGKACEHIGYQPPSVPSCSDITSWVFVDLKQAYNCTAKFLLFVISWAVEKFSVIFFLRSTLGIFSSGVKSRQSKDITAVLGPSRIGEINFSYLKTK